MAAASEYATAFPLPPKFYKLYTNENLDVKNKDITATTTALEQQLYLEPPPPIQGRYQMFGNQYDTDDHIRSLQELNLEQLYPNEPDLFDCKSELKKLNHSLLLNFLELLRVLVDNPSMYDAKVQDMRLILINMHHLINSYRPHQARDTLMLMMERQIERKQKTIKELNGCCAQVQEILESTKRDILEESRRVCTDNANFPVKVEEDEGDEEIERSRVMPEQLYAAMVSHAMI